MKIYHGGISILFVMSGFFYRSGFNLILYFFRPRRYYLCMDLSIEFSSAMTLTLLQGLVTVLCLEFMKRKGWAEYPDFNWNTAMKVAPLSFVFIAYVVISLFALERVNVPMFTALRRLTVVFVMIEEYFLLQVTPSRRVVDSVVVMMIGAAIAAWKDLTFEPYAYFLLFLTNLFTSLYTVYINVVRKDTGLNQFAMLYYSNVTTMPILFLIALYTGDIQRALSFPYMYDIFFQMNFQASIFLAFLLNVSTFYCTSLNSARTQTVVGQLKNFFAFLLGLVLFDDYIYDPINMVGLWVGFAGSVWYSYIVAKEKQDNKGPTPATNNSNTVTNNNNSALSNTGAVAPSTTEKSLDDNGTSSSSENVISADSTNDVEAGRKRIKN